MPGEGVVDDGDMHSSAGPTILVRGSTGVKEDGNSLMGCIRTPSVGYTSHKGTMWPWKWLGTESTQKACIRDLPLQPGTLRANCEWRKHALEVLGSYTVVALMVQWVWKTESKIWFRE
jgi:hypothetical protein